MVDTEVTTFRQLPEARAAKGRQITITDEASGRALLFSDGEDWYRASDGKLATALPLVIGIFDQSNGAAGPPVAFGYSPLTELLSLHVLGWDGATGAWKPLVDGTASAKANAGGGGTGPGPGGGQYMTRLARKIADQTGQTVRLICLTYSGLAIARFLPTATEKAIFEDGSTHDSLNFFQLFELYLRTGGYPLDLLVWGQGEANAGATEAEYYAPLRTIFDATQKWPGSPRWLINGPIGGENQRAYVSGVASGASMFGVQRAERRLAAEEPRKVLYCDHTDMSGHTAWFGGHIDNHFTTFAGHEERVERGFAALRGDPPRPAVAKVDDIRDILAWGYDHAYRHSITVAGGRNQVSTWQDDIGSSSLLPLTNAGTHGVTDTDVPGRPYVALNDANAEAYKLTGIAGGTVWNICAIARHTALGGTRTLFGVQGSGNNRFYLRSIGQSNQPALFYESSGTQFSSGPGAPAADLFWHVYLLTLDVAAGTAKLYIDGILAGTITGLNTGLTFATVDLHLGSLNGTEYHGGRVIRALWKVGGSVASAAEALLMMSSQQVELKLPN